MLHKIPKHFTNKTTPMTAEVAGKAITLVREVGLNQQQAAALLGINQGRISEVLNGKRYAGVSPYPSDQLSFSF